MRFRYDVINKAVKHGKSASSFLDYHSICSISNAPAAEMKAFLLVFLVGCAAASSLYEALEDEAEEFYHDFMVGMEEAPSLTEYFGLEDDHFLADENDVKTELSKKLRETLDHLLEKIKEAVEHGKTVREDLQLKLKEIRDKMKDLKVDMGDKAKDLIEKIREKSREFLKNLLEKLGLNDNKRSVQDEELELALAAFNFKDIFNKLKQALIDKVDKEQLKAKVEQLFGKGSEMADALLKVINEKGDQYKQKLHDLIDRFLGKEKRSIKDYWEKVKDYFKDLHIDLQEKYSKFGEWVKNVVDKGLNKSKDKMENIKQIARELVDHAKGLSKEVAEEGLNFLRPYKEDLGSLYDQVKETVKEARLTPTGNSYVLTHYCHVGIFSGNRPYEKMILAALFALLIWFPRFTALDNKNYSYQMAWKVNLFLISCLWSPLLEVDAVPPPEEVAKLKEKIDKGKTLLEDLNILLTEIRETLKKGKTVEKTKLNKVVEIKENFQDLKVDPGDLSKDLLEEFRDRTLEAFKLMLENFNLGEVPLIKVLEETKDFDESSNTLARRFAEEL
ncbi:hypothetical protein JTE90_026561 [Oedothorax gibbosus]|uniref:Laminin subunit alpha-2 n=1 Tax=Oedothorax gibbosus TaxID=931172 RepID=A0AAV6U0Z8_9ARAC|nr:hypothetical protein JTE90_026561 [Oedothorax gibbosus]